MPIGMTASFSYMMRFWRINTVQDTFAPTRRTCGRRRRRFRVVVEAVPYQELSQLALFHSATSHRDIAVQL